MRLLVIGAGGHAQVVIEAAEAAGWSIAGVVGRAGDRDEVLGHAVLRVPDASAPSLSAPGAEPDAFIVAIGDNAARAERYAAALETGLAPATVIHPTATISPTAFVGPGSFVAAGVVVNALTRVGENCILNTGCVVEHDITIGDHTLVGPLAGLCGGVRVGEGVLFGAGATAIPGAEVGDHAIVAAGAVVTGEVAPRTLVAGVPARHVRGLEGAS